MDYKMKANTAVLLTKERCVYVLAWLIGSINWRVRNSTLCSVLYCEIQVLYLFWPFYYKKDVGTLKLPQDCNDWWFGKAAMCRRNNWIGISVTQKKKIKGNNKLLSVWKLTTSKWTAALGSCALLTSGNVGHTLCVLLSLFAFWGCVFKDYF